MATNFMNIFPLVMVSTLLYFTTMSSGATIQITSAIPSSDTEPVKFQIRQGPGGPLTSWITLVSGQKYQLMTTNDVLYSGTATHSRDFASFQAYDPARDSGHATVYWKVDNSGFSISYDDKTYNLNAPWETE